MTVLELSVPDMGCRRCVREVTAELRDVPGVHTVTVDAARSHVTLIGSMAPADVLAALARTNYRARLYAGHAGDATGANKPWVDETPPRSGPTDAQEGSR